MPTQWISPLLLKNSMYGSSDRRHFDFRLILGNAEAPFPPFAESPRKPTTTRVERAHELRLHRLRRGRWRTGFIMKIGLISLPFTGHSNPMAALGRKVRTR